MKYEGKKLIKAQLNIQGKTFALDGEGAIIDKEGIKEDIFPYLPSENLITSVAIARLLNRPLLVRGEPGAGKTRLAQAIAFELHGADYRKHYFEWHIKSTTKAKEGLYAFDHLQRLRDLELAKFQAVQGKEELADIPAKKYRSFGPLGKTFITSTQKNKPAVLLIDEIDKADIDFPNDLLLELDQKRFEIPETNEPIVAQEPPIIIITSNDEKELPNAFLRRCVFHYIKFPSTEELKSIASERLRAEIMKLKTKKAYRLSKEEKEFLDKAVLHFQRKYKEMKGNSNIDKIPSTSEMLDWIKALYFHKNHLLSSILENEEELLPFYNTMIKSYNDQILILGKQEI